MWPFKRTKIPEDPSQTGDDAIERISRAEESHLEEIAEKLEATRKEKFAARAFREERITEVQSQLEPFLPTIFRHISALRVRRDQLVRADPYGNLVTDAWRAEIDYYIRRSLLNDDAERFKLLQRQFYFRLFSAVDWIARNANFLKNSRDAEPGIWDAISPAEFEQRCRSALVDIGWSARTTGTTGDQGIDIIATDGMRKLVVQCKRYRGSVGNKAVQEIIAGRAFEKADLSAVVSTGSFTASARQLAAASGVLLLHPSQIAEVFSLGTSPSVPAAVSPQHVEVTLNALLGAIVDAEDRAIEAGQLRPDPRNEDEELYEQALEVLKATRRVSTSMLQRSLRIGYLRAERMMQIMEEKGIVGPENGSSPREILVDLDSL